MVLPYLRRHLGESLKNRPAKKRPCSGCGCCVAGAARRAAKVLWLCATAVDKSGSPRLWLWAVDRLSGVTMNGASACLLASMTLRHLPRDRSGR